MADSMMDWRSEQFRRKVITQIDEAIRSAPTPMTKSSAEMENHVFLKAKTREEYLALVARLILHVKEMRLKFTAGQSSTLSRFPQEDEYDSEIEKELCGKVRARRLPRRKQDCLFVVDYVPLKNLSPSHIFVKRCAKVLQFRSPRDMHTTSTFFLPSIAEHTKDSNKVVVVQLGLLRYWNLVKDEPESNHHLISVFWRDFSGLVKFYDTKCSNSKLIMNEFLPMFFRVDDKTRNCEEFREKLNKSLRSHAAKAGISVVQHRNFDKTDFYDGIHLSARTGIPKYVRNVRRVIDTMVCVKSDISVL